MLIRVVASMTLVASLVPLAAALPPGLIHRWSADANANDAVGGADGTISGDVAFVEGVSGQAFKFNGGQITCSTSAGNFGTGDFTISYWMRHESITHHLNLISKREACFLGKFWDIRTEFQGVSLFFEVWDNSLNPLCQNPSGCPASDVGVWHHIVHLRQGLVGKSYVDGVAYTYNNACIANLTNSAPLRFGSGPCVGGPDATIRYNGSLDEIQFYDRALTHEEVLSLMNPAPPPCEGDANDDGKVNFADVTNVLANFGATYPGGTGPGDADGSGTVEFADITEVLANFGQSCL